MFFQQKLKQEMFLIESGDNSAAESNKRLT